MTGSWIAPAAERVVDGNGAHERAAHVDVGERAGRRHAVEALQARLGVPREHGVACAAARSRPTGVTTMSVAASASKRPTIWLPAVFDSPRVATSAPTPMTVPSTVRTARARAGPREEARRAPRSARGSARAAIARAPASRRCAHGCVLLGQPAVDDAHPRGARARPTWLLVRDDDEREAGVAELLEEREHRLGVDRVEVARRLVAQQQRSGRRAAPGRSRRAAARRPTGAWAGSPRDVSCRRARGPRSARSRAALAARCRDRPRRASRSRAPCGARAG